MKLNRHQMGFVVFVGLPALLGYLIYRVRFKVDYVANPFPDNPDITASWNTWHAYQHEWCYLVAAFIWFAAVLVFLGRGSKEQDS